MVQEGEIVEIMLVQQGNSCGSMRYVKVDAIDDGSLSLRSSCSLYRASQGMLYQGGDTVEWA